MLFQKGGNFPPRKWGSKVPPSSASHVGDPESSLTKLNEDTTSIVGLYIKCSRDSNENTWHGFRAGKYVKLLASPQYLQAAIARKPVRCFAPLLNGDCFWGEKSCKYKNTTSFSQTAFIAEASFPRR